MSIETLQQRLADLKFSLEEQVKSYELEEKDAADVHKAWEEGEPGEDQPDEDHDSWQDEEPSLVDNGTKINALESAKDKIDDAIEALDAGLEY